VEKYIFSSQWFELNAKSIWDELIPQIYPTKILEVVSFEGASSCYLINKLAINHDIEIHCIDSWAGGIEHQKGGVWEIEMSQIERNFDSNIKLASENKNVQVFKYKTLSDLGLSQLLVEGKRDYFDFIYIDGSHQAPDVLCDAVLAFRLLKIGGYIVFDDYLWSENLSTGIDPLRCPKLAIDNFVNTYIRGLKILDTPSRQFYAQKIYNL
jgi:predicted O-methyltransferase YrrM